MICYLYLLDLIVVAHMHLESIQFPWIFQLFREPGKHTVSASWLRTQCDLMFLSSMVPTTMDCTLKLWRKTNLLFLSCLCQVCWHIKDKVTDAVWHACFLHSWLWEPVNEEGAYSGLGVSCCSRLEWSRILCHLSKACLTIHHHHLWLPVHGVQPVTTLARNWASQKHLWKHLRGFLLASWEILCGLRVLCTLCPKSSGFLGPVSHSCPGTEEFGDLCEAWMWGGGIYTPRLVHTQSLY